MVRSNEHVPSKKNAPKIAPIGADFQAAVPKNRRLFGANFTPKTRLMHAEKHHFSAPKRRRFGANFQAPIQGSMNAHSSYSG